MPILVEGDDVKCGTMAKACHGRLRAVWESMGLIQEIIKVREWIPHIGVLTKVIPLKLFLDMVLISSEDVTRAMRRQPMRLSRNYPRRIAEMFSALSAVLFFGRAFVCFVLVWLFII